MADDEGMHAAGDERPETPPGEDAPEAMEWRAHPGQVLNALPFAGGALLLLLCAVAFYFVYDLGEGEKLRSIVGSVCRWGLLVFAVLVVLYLLVKFARLKAITYHITDGHLELSTGVLSRHTEMLECYRIRDVETTRPLHLRAFGLGHIDLVTSDRTAPRLRLAGIKDPVGVTRRLRDEVERCRLRARVMGLDAGAEADGVPD